MHQPQSVSRGTTIVVSELTQLGNVFDLNMRSVDYDTDGFNFAKARDSDLGFKPSWPAIRSLS